MVVHIKRKPATNRYTFLEGAIINLENLFWSVDYAGIMDMLDQAAPTDSPDVVQYQAYKFTVRARQVSKVQRISAPDTPVRCVACQDTGKVVVYNECGRCGGKGCPQCSNGLVRDWIPCQESACTVNSTAKKSNGNGYQKRSKYVGKRNFNV